MLDRCLLVCEHGSDERGTGKSQAKSALCSFQHACHVNTRGVGFPREVIGVRPSYKRLVTIVWMRGLDHDIVHREESCSLCAEGLRTSKAIARESAHLLWRRCHCEIVRCWRNSRQATCTTSVLESGVRLVRTFHWPEQLSAERDLRLRPDDD